MNYDRSHIRRRLGPRRGTRTGRRILLWCLQILLLLALSAFIIGGIWAFRYVKGVIDDAPQLTAATVSPAQAATYIYNEAGKRVQKLTLPEANRDLVSIDKVPLDLQHAFVSIEDERFYTHHGIDPQGILRAAWRGLTSGSFSEGASTITQQLLKNSVFTDWTSEKTFQQRLRRKIQEQYLALKLEKLMSKEQILEDYMNTINLGAGCYGVQAAAYRYFGKDVSQLALSECAVIAGITQNPTRYNPITNPQDNAQRQHQVLGNMLEQGYISQTQYDEALADDVYSRIHANEDNTDSSSSIYTFYQDALIDQVIQDLQTEKGYTYKQAFKAVYTGGLRIYSAQDDQIQQICDEEFANAANFPAGTEVGIDYALSLEDEAGQVTNYGNEELRSWVRSSSDPDFDLMYDSTQQAEESAAAFKASVLGEGDTVLGERVTITPQPQASAVIIDQSTGYVKAIVGGRGDKDASLTLNRATYTTRQPGSTFKVLAAYAPALNECGQTLATIYDNADYYYENGQKVSNWDLGSTSGPTTIREAIVRSVNVVAVECITQITPQLGFQYLESFGFTTLVDSLDTGSGTLTDVGQALPLGGLTRGVTNLELCAAYASIANLGQYIAPKFYTQVLDQYGDVILDNSAPAGKTVLKNSTAYLLTDAMKGVISDPQGTAYGTIDLGYMPVAGKSGTTSSYKDIWFAGYTPYYTCCVWGGYDNNEDLPEGELYHTYNKVLWNAVMNRIHSDLQITSFRMPTDILRAKVCRETGMLAAPGCDAYEELFAADDQPLQYCTKHGDGSYITPAQDETDNFSAQSGAQPSTGRTDTGGSDTPDIVIYSQDQAVIPAPSDSALDGQSGQTPDGSLAGQSGQTPDGSLAGQGTQDQEPVIVLENTP